MNAYAVHTNTNPYLYTVQASRKQPSQRPTQNESVTGKRVLRLPPCGVKAARCLYAADSAN